MDAAVPPSVLIVEDDQAIAELIQVMLRPDGYFFRRVADGKSGVDVAKREKPDVILMDVMMPGMDGYTAASLLAADEATREIPVIILTAKKGMKEAFSSCSNFFGFLEKPFDMETLRNHVKKAVLSRRL
jgi:CheY-like chemotaxis protein